MEIIIEIWDNIKDNIQEKNKVLILKDILFVMHDHGQISEDDLDDLRNEDKYFRDAVDIIYKSEEFEDEDEDDMDYE